MRYRVTAPLVNARTRDVIGNWVLRAFQVDGWLPEDSHPEDVERLLRKGMIAQVDSESAAGSTDAEPESGNAGPDDESTAEESAPKPTKARR